MKDIKPGIYPDLSNEDYHGHLSSYSGSSYKDAAKYPYNLPWQRANKEEKTIFNIGTAAHTAILEPEKWEKEIAVCPNDKLSKSLAKAGGAYKAWLAEQGGKTTVTEKERDSVLRMRDAVHENPNHSEAKEYLTGPNGLAEVSVFWEELFKTEEVDEETGYKYLVNHTHGDPDGCHVLLNKARPDYIPRELVLTDLKTTATKIDQQGFERHSYDMRYHWSAALALRGVSMATGKQHRTYVFVVVESQPPHEVAVFKSSEEFIALGRLEVMEMMGRVAWCDKHKFWPGAPNKLQQVGLPPWAYKTLNAGIE